MKLSGKAIISDAQGRVLVLRRSAASRHFPGKWDFPGGKTDPGETFEEAVLRETREETGLDIVLTRVVGADEGEVAGLRIAYLFVGGTMAAGPVPAVRLSPEHDAAQWVSPAQLPGLDLVPSFRQVAAACAAQAGALA